MLNIDWINQKWIYQEDTMNNEVIVKKEELLAKLKSNLEIHQKIAQEAREGYIKKTQEVLAAKLKLAEAGEFVYLNFNLPVPEDHSKEYKQTIAMVEWDTRVQLQLTPSEFKSYILDEWSWDRHSLTTNAFYSSTAASGCMSKGY